MFSLEFPSGTRSLTSFSHLQHRHNLTLHSTTVKSMKCVLQINAIKLVCKDNPAGSSQSRLARKCNRLYHTSTTSQIHFAFYLTGNLKKNLIRQWKVLCQQCVWNVLWSTFCLWSLDVFTVFRKTNVCTINSAEYYSTAIWNTKIPLQSVISLGTLHLW